MPASSCDAACVSRINTRDTGQTDHFNVKISRRVAVELSTTCGASEVLGTDDLMNQEFCIILTVNVTAFAVEMVRVFLLMLLHG